MSLSFIDLFAGLGGFTTGAQQAGAVGLWAGNHWPAAVATHARNHPDMEHACQDLQQQPWGLVPKHQLLLASPACQGHARARGKDQPHHDDDRCTAYAVLGAANYHRPDFLLVENVPEFLKWDGYRGWKITLEDFGYHLTEQVLDCADFGLPQNRVRLFVCGSRRAPLRLRSPWLPHAPAAPVIDWEEPRWTPAEGPHRAPATLRRIARGRQELGDRFLVPYYSSAGTGRSLARPIGTLTTRPRYGVVDGDRYRMITVAEARQFMGFPAGYVLPEPCVNARGQKLSAVDAAHWMLGNAVPPVVACELVRQIQAAA